MQYNSIFKELDLESKRDYIYRLLSHRISNLKNWDRFLETFVFWASEEKLNNFYDAMMNWDSEYITKLIYDLKAKKAQVIDLKNRFSHEVMNYNENKLKHDNEKNFNSILSNI